MSNKIKFLFTRSKGIGGWFIRLVLMSHHNHVGVQIDGNVYEAKFFGGVTKKSITQFYEENNIKLELSLAVENKETVKEFLEAQLGKPYDWLAILAIPLRRDWHKKDSWMCSELAAQVLIEDGKQMPIESSRITPRDLLFIAPVVSRILDRHSFD